MFVVGVDGCRGGWLAVRLRTPPPSPALDNHGLPMEIVYFSPGS